MSNNLKGFTILGIIVVLVSVLFFVGCSVNNPVNSEPDEYIGSDIGLNKSGAFSSTSLSIEPPGDNVNVIEDSEYIGASVGGTINIDRDIYQHKFIVEADGLNEDAIISVKSKKEKINNKEVISFEFGPEGLIFNKPSKLNFEMAELNFNSHSAKLYYYDPEAGSWVMQSSKQVKNGHVVFDIYHFSRYAISD